MDQIDDHESRISALEAQISALVIHQSRLQATILQIQMRAGEARPSVPLIAADPAPFILDEATLVF